jgi:signal transduction histidine kinase
MGVLAELSPKVQRLVEVADQNSRRLALLVNDIIDIDKITTGQMSFEFRNEEVKSIILELIDTMRLFAGRLNIDLQFSNPSKDIYVVADRSRVVQILNNLISNAVKFSPEGGKVDINVEVRERDVRIAVYDRGPGIPEDFRKRLFDRFAQAENTLSRRRDGSGLGLYISKQLIERMEGSIGIDPRPGGGTIAWIMLPVHSKA